MAQYFFTAAAWTAVALGFLVVHLVGDLSHRSSTPLRVRAKLAFLWPGALQEAIAAGGPPVQRAVRRIKIFAFFSVAFAVAGLCTMVIESPR